MKNTEKHRIKRLGTKELQIYHLKHYFVRLSDIRKF